MIGTSIGSGDLLRDRLPLAWRAAMRELTA
jgi:hypothetical protein